MHIPLNVSSLGILGLIAAAEEGSQFRGAN